MRFHSIAPMLKYRQNLLNSWCFSNLASVFNCTNQTKEDNAIEICIEESLKNQVGNSIDFANAMLKNKKNLKVNRNYIIAKKIYI